MSNNKVQVPFLPGESQQIGGLKVVYLPDWMITRVNCAPHVAGVLMPTDLADSFLADLRKAGVGFANEAIARNPDLPRKEPKESE